METCCLAEMASAHMQESCRHAQLSPIQHRGNAMPHTGIHLYVIMYVCSLVCCMVENTGHVHGEDNMGTGCGVVPLGNFVHTRKYVHVYVYVYLYA